MKKILLAALVAMAIAALCVTLFLPKHRVGKSYPRNTVTTAVKTGAAALGGVLEEQRTVSRRLRNMGLIGRSGAWFRAVTGGDDPADVDEFLIRTGSNKITITSLHRAGDVHELRIRPSPSALKQSADLKSEILKSLPGLTFEPQ
jgi:hypothetical protein